MADGLKERTARGLMWGAINNLSSQILSVLTGIVLGRLLAPADYGMVGMLTVFTAIAGTLQDSGFTVALTNLKTATHKDYNAVFWFSTLMSVSLCGLLFLCAPLIARFFHQPELVSLSRLVFVSMVLSGLGVAHAACMFRNMMNRERAVTNFLALAGSGIVGITLALNGYSYWSLAWQQFVYMAIVDACRFYFVRWRPSLPIDFSPIRQMFGFSSKVLVTNVVNQVNGNLMSLVFARLFNAGAVGNYTQAAKWNQLGYSFISGTLQQVAQPVLARVSSDEGRQLHVFRKMLRFTAFGAMPSMFGLSLIAEFVVLLLGPQWTDSVPLLRILCVSGAFIPIHTLYQNLFLSQGRSDTYMWCTIAQIVALLLVVLLFSRWGIVPMVTAYAAVLVLWTGVWQLLAHRLTGLRHADFLKDVLPFVVIAAVCMAAAYFLTRGIGQQILLIVSRIVIAALLYIFIMKIANVRIFNECTQFLLDKFK